MNVSIPPELEAFVTSKVASGRYTSPTEVVHDALRVLEDRDQWLREQIGPAYDALMADPDSAISADAVFDALRNHHQARTTRSA